MNRSRKTALLRRNASTMLKYDSFKEYKVRHLKAASKDSIADFEEIFNEVNAEVTSNEQAPDSL